MIIIMISADAKERERGGERAAADAILSLIIIIYGKFF